MIVEQRKFSILCDIEGCFEGLEDYESEIAVIEVAESEGWETRKNLTRDSESHLCPEHAEER